MLSERNGEVSSPYPIEALGFPPFGISKNKKLWLLEEQEQGTWLVKVDRIPQAVLDTETAIAVLDNKFFVS